MKERTEREITLAHHAACTCGGKGPGEGGCPACEMWHALFSRPTDSDRANQRAIADEVWSGRGVPVEQN